MGGNSYLDKLEIKRQASVIAAEETAKQLCMDTAQIALHRMGWGYDKIMEFSLMWADLYNHYFGALQKPKSKQEDERDLFRDHMDKELKDIVKNKAEFIPFEERYRYAGKVFY